MTEQSSWLRAAALIEGHSEIDTALHAFHEDATDDNATGIVAAVIDALAAPAPQPEPLTDEQRAVLNFLLGADDLDGVVFGERHPTERGAFWWRNRLRAAFEAQAKSPSSSVTDGNQDATLRAKVADLLHLLEFAEITTPTPGDKEQAIRCMAGIASYLGIAEVTATPEGKQS